MLPDELDQMRAIWQALDDDARDLVSRWLARAMTTAGVSDRRCRLRVLRDLEELDPLSFAE